MSSKKTPPTFIDDVVSRFHECEDRRRAASVRRRYASGTSVRSLPTSLDADMVPSDQLGRRDDDDAEDVFAAGAGEAEGGAGAGEAQRRRSVGAETDTEEGSNRTRLIRVGDTQLSLISPDRKSVILQRKFKDISFCSQVTPRTAGVGRSASNQIGALSSSNQIARSLSNQIGTLSSSNQIGTLSSSNQIDTLSSSNQIGTLSSSYVVENLYNIFNA